MYFEVERDAALTDISSLVDTHFKIKAKLAEIEADYKQKCAPYEAARDKVQGALVEALDEMGVENVKTAHGTPYFTHPETYKITDPEAFLGWVVENDAYSILPETLARKEAIRAQMPEGEAAPPGVDVTTVRKLCVRKS